MAFCSAGIAKEQLPLLSLLQPVAGNSSSQLWVPAGGPLYPMEINRLSLVNTTPTCFFIQCDLLARLTANSIKISSKSGRDIEIWDSHVKYCTGRSVKMPCTPPKIRKNPLKEKISCKMIVNDTFSPYFCMSFYAFQHHIFAL